jgi:hypothetical protein
MFLSTKYNITSNRDSHNMYIIHSLNIVYIELHDVLYTNNKSYEVLTLLGRTTILPIAVPITYCGIIILKNRNS